MTASLIVGGCAAVISCAYAIVSIAAPRRHGRVAVAAAIAMTACGAAVVTASWWLPRCVWAASMAVNAAVFGARWARWRDA